MPEIPPRIAVDAMGGDIGPRINVAAAIQAAREGIRITLVGDAEALRGELARLNAPPGLPIDIVHASQVVDMNEKPSDALRRKKDSSIQVACQLVKDGQADGVVSAG
ncbi:MAG: phosphate--acyl-ACP acyltransferase, partial [Humidesulfovibrio sp.]|nr:phosphate--acyl-ACP acyltransferase [Humidesulfovibrio sp.]